MVDPTQKDENVIRFFIAGDPVPQQRHRDRKPVRSKKGKLFTPKYDPSATAKQQFLLQAKSKAPERVWTGPIQMDLIFVFPIPKSRKDLNPGDYHIQKPDRDNLMKFVKDALGEIPAKGRRAKVPSLFYKDDCQICAGPTHKIYGAPKHVGVHVTLTRLSYPSGARI